MTDTPPQPAPADDDDRRARFEALWREHHGALWAYGRRRGEPDPDDLAAECFAVAWRRLDEAPADALPWLLAIGRRVLWNRQRSERRRGRLLARLGSEPHATAPDPAELVGSDRGLHRAFSALSAADREVLVLAAWEGLGAGQIAVALGIPAPIASARLHRARRRLRSHLEPSATPATDPVEPPA